MPTNSSVKVRRSLPAYRLHKRSQQAVVTLNGRDFYLGSHGTLESREAYDRLIAEWLANGRRLPVDSQQSELPTVNEIILAYWRHVQSYYVKNGSPTSEQHIIKSALRPLRKLYGNTTAAKLSPLNLKAVREEYLQQELSRSTVNRYAGQIVRMFKWAVENEFSDVSVRQSLNPVSGLRKGRSPAPDPESVRPVPEEVITAVEPYVAPQVWAMIQLQLLTGMRPGEVIQMRWAEIDQSGNPRIYIPQTHKNAHRGMSRQVALGPRAQQVLEPWMRANPKEFLFDASEAKSLVSARSTIDDNATQCGRQSRQQASQSYSTASYRRAIQRACERAFGMPRELRNIGQQLAKVTTEERESTRRQLEQRAKKWRAKYCRAPNQLRHNAATRIRKEYGLEAARVALGHRSAVNSEIYAEADHAETLRIMSAIG